MSQWVDLRLWENVYGNHSLHAVGHMYLLEITPPILDGMGALRI